MKTQIALTTVAAIAAGSAAGTFALASVRRGPRHPGRHRLVEHEHPAARAGPELQLRDRPDRRLGQRPDRGRAHRRVRDRHDRPGRRRQLVLLGPGRWRAREPRRDQLRGLLPRRQPDRQPPDHGDRRAPGRASAWACRTASSSGPPTRAARAPRPRTAVSTGIGEGWHHAVGVWNRNTLSTGLYLDGQFVGDAALAAGTTGWVGGNEATLGGLNTSAATTMDLASITEFDGAIAAFNYYNGELSARRSPTSTTPTSSPRPGALALVGAAGLCATRRRRN
jgi:MYXO-CTERM domain-containing protein